MWTRQLALVAGSMAAILGWSSQGAAQLLTPESPEVRSAIEKGIKFLEANPGGGVGPLCLAALTLVKNGAGPEHPVVQRAVSTVQAEVASGPENVRADIYSTSVAIMFLVALDPKLYRYEIEKLVKSLHRRQKEQGAWGYPEGHQTGGKTCDSSMTQFAVLALFEAAEYAEIRTDPAIWERVMVWLIRTQDPSGSFGYQGTVSTGKIGERVKQSGSRHSMSIAGACSVYICRDQLGLAPLKKAANDETPDALRLVETEAQKRARVKTKLDEKLINRCRGDVNRWLKDNFEIEKPEGWLHYYLYGLERYQTLLEAEGTTVLKSNWYHLGAKLLLSTQKEDGSWEGNAGNPAETCFAVLFLLRSMKKSLSRSAERFPEGLLAAGRGIPPAQDVRVRSGQVTPRPLDDLAQSLVLLQSPALPGQEAQRAAALETLEDLAQRGEREQIAAHAEALDRLTKASQPEVRLAAVKALGRGRSFEHVPALIDRLEDADLEVVLAAREALVAISRRSDAFGFDPQGSATARQAAIEKWHEWYRAVCPDAQSE